MNKKQLEAHLAALRTAHEKDFVEMSAENFDLSSVASRKTAYDARQVEIEQAETNLAAALEVEKRVRDRAQSTASASVRENLLDKPFNGFGDQLLHIVEASRPGGRIDPRLKQLTATGGGINVPSDGGFLIQQQYSEDIFRQIAEVGQLFPLCATPITIKPNSNELNVPYVDETSRVTGSRWGGVRVYRANEGDTVTASKPKMGNLKIKLEKLMGIAYATDELLEDAVAAGQIYSQAFAEEMAYTIDDEIVNGDGAGKMLGILSAGCLITIAKESGQTNTTVVANNILKMRARMPFKFRKNARWLINQDVEAQLPAMYLATGSNSGQLVYMPAGGISGLPYDTLYGMPVMPIEQCKTLGTVGDIILADMSQYVTINKGGLEAESSMHVRFVYDEMTFRWTYRINGQPKWRTAITPANGTNTLSPFIALAGRP